ncbi:MAG: substrate-binding domain-containing protein [Clostridia bacterium]|nr:substrate-binding domain-containing protein [Clostridia bacterium]
MNGFGLALIPIDEPQVIQKTNQMKANGIQVMTFNSELKDIRGFRYIGQDHFKVGRVAGGLMTKLLPDGGEVSIISSKPLSCHPDRMNSFRTRPAENDNHVSVIEISENQDGKADTFKITLDYLNRHPNLRGLYLSGNGNIGVKSALAIAQPDHRISIICHDLSEETEELLNDGIVDFVISQNALDQGCQIVTKEML